MTLREFAKQNGHEIIGKLTRRPEWEYTTDYKGDPKHSGCKHYSDEAGNEYISGKNGHCIVTADGAVI